VTYQAGQHCGKVWSLQLPVEIVKKTTNAKKETVSITEPLQNRQHVQNP